MSSSRKSKFKAAPYLLNSVIFFIGGIGALEEERFYFALTLFITSLINLLVIKADDKNMANFLVMSLNALLALILTIDMFAQGKQYIQYAWMLVFILSLVVAIISYSKYRKAIALRKKAITKE